MSDVEDLEPGAIRDEGVPELHRYAGGSIEFRRSDAGGDLRMERVFKADDDQPGIAQHVGVNARDGDAAGAVERSIRIKRKRAPQEVVAWIAIEESGDTRR